MTDERLSIEGSKYTIVIRNNGAQVEILRGGYPWINEPAGSKMLIAMFYELQTSRKLLSEISYDFDPNKRLGPPCGPEMLAKIKAYAEQYQVDLDE